MNILLSLLIFVTLPGKGRLDVKVINGTNLNEKVWSWIYLNAISPEGEEFLKDSIFYRGVETSFKGLDISLYYRVVCAFEGVPYSSEVVRFTPDTLHKKVEIFVYKTTKSSDSLIIRDYHIGFVREDDILKGSEVVILLNIAVTTFLDTHAFKFILPEGGVETFTPIEPPTFENWSYLGDTIFLSSPIYPGEGALAFNYLIPAKNFTVFREFPAVIHSFRVLTSRDINVSSLDLIEKESIKRGERVFRVYVLREPKRRVVFEVKMIKKFRLLIPALAIFLILILVFLLIWTKRGKTEGKDVFEELVELEKLWERGEIDERTYREKREEFLKRLESQ